MNLLLSKICDVLFRRGIPIQPPKKVLVIRSGAIGDVLMSTPLLHNLKESYANIHISYLVGEWSKCALTNNPNVDDVLSFDDRHIYHKHLFPTLKLILRLRKQKFDSCFVLDKSWHWGILAWLAGIPVRIGFDRCGEGFACTHKIQFDGSNYELEYYLELLGKLDRDLPIRYNSIEFYLSDDDRAFANNFIRKFRIVSKKRVALVAGGANNPAHQMHVKRWLLEHFVKLAKKLELAGIKVIWIGSREDESVINNLVKAVPETINAADKNLTIAQSTALMEKCHCVVTPDSGPLHMAASTKTPIIALFGPTSPQRFAPKNAAVLYHTEGCHNCYSIFTYGTLKTCKTHECMKNIKVDEVFNAVLKCIN